MSRFAFYEEYKKNSYFGHFYFSTKKNECGQRTPYDTNKPFIHHFLTDLEIFSFQNSTRRRNIIIEY